MMSLSNKVREFDNKITDEKKRIESEIQKTDKQIDELVYKLYDLTVGEIKIVEDM